jgi:hypothetical protein
MAAFDIDKEAAAVKPIGWRIAVSVVNHDRALG